MHGLCKPSIGPSVNDLGGSTDRAVPVQHDVICHLKGGEGTCQYGRRNGKREGIRRIGNLKDVLERCW